MFNEHLLSFSFSRRSHLRDNCLSIHISRTCTRSPSRFSPPSALLLNSSIVFRGEDHSPLSALRHGDVLLLLHRDHYHHYTTTASFPPFLTRDSLTHTHALSPPLSPSLTLSLSFSATTCDLCYFARIQWWKSQRNFSAAATSS